MPRGEAHVVAGDAAAMAALFGRDDELERVVGLVRDPAVRLVTLSGRGGIGKTRLALEVARELDGERTGQVVALELAGLRPGSELLSKVATALGVTRLPGATVLESLVGRLSMVQLLVLDNMEHVLDRAGDVVALLERCAGLTVLVTSQIPLAVPAEHVVRLGPLEAGPGTGASFDEVVASPAVALYRRRAMAADDRFFVDAGNVDAVADLCRELEGLPLAIELAAARSPSLPPAELLDRLQGDRLAWLRRPGRHRAAADDDRRHSLEAAIGWTWQLLDPDEQELLGRLAAAVGPFSRRDAEELSGSGDQRADGTGAAPLEALDRLVLLNLVDRVPDTDPARFRLPASVRQFALDRLEEGGGAPTAWQARIAWLTARARCAAAGLDADDDTEEHWRADLAERQDEMVDALSTCVAARDGAAATELLAALGPLWFHAGCTAAQLALFDAGLALAAAAGLCSPAHADALLWRVRIARPAPGSTAPDLLDRGERIAKELDDARLMLRACYVRMHLVVAQGDVAGAVSVVEQGLALAAVLRSQRWLARFEAWSAMVAHQSGDGTRARMLAGAALRRARDRDARTTVMASMVLWPLSSESPARLETVPPLEETLALAQATGQFLTSVTLLFWLTVEAAEHGELDAACRWCAEGLAVVTAAPGSAVAPYGLMAAVELAVAADDLEVAAVLQGAGAAVLDKVRWTIPPERVVAHERVVHRLQRLLGPVEFANRAEPGESLGVPDALCLALEWTRRTFECHRAPAAPDDPAEGAILEGLSARQREILPLLAAGLSNKEIGAKLGISPKTVMHHTGSLYQRLGVHSRTEAAALAGRAGLGG